MNEVTGLGEPVTVKHPNKAKIEQWATELRDAPMEPPKTFYNLIEITDQPGKWTFTCGNPNCQLPHLIVGSKPYVNEKAVAHVEWCGKRRAPMAWGYSRG